MNRNEDLDRTLSRMLSAVGAEAEPALLTRARARIDARARQPFLLRWAMQPVALGASVALFVASFGLSFALLSTAPPAPGESTTLIESLLEERGIEDANTLIAPDAEPGTDADSGGAR